jgi:hypothetical protein
MTERLKHTPARIPPRSVAASSKATIGRRMFVEGGDGRSLWGRRWRDLCLAHASDLGGMELLSEAQVSIIKRVSAMECELEAMEARMSEGQHVDVDQYGRLTGRLCRLLELIGIKRLAKPLDPMSELAKALEGYAGTPVDDDDDDGDEPLPIERHLQDYLGHKSTRRCVIRSWTRASSAISGGTEKRCRQDALRNRAPFVRNRAAHPEMRLYKVKASTIATKIGRWGPMRKSLLTIATMRTFTEDRYRSFAVASTGT